MSEKSSDAGASRIWGVYDSPRRKRVQQGQGSETSRQRSERTLSGCGFDSGCSAYSLWLSPGGRGRGLGAVVSAALNLLGDAGEQHETGRLSRNRFARQPETLTGHMVVGDDGTAGAVDEQGIVL